MNGSPTKFAALAASVAIGALGATGAFAAEVTGAGSSAAAPIYSKWADAYQKATGNKINYQSVGSGAGVQQIEAKTVDFGASDMPLLSPADLEKNGLVQFPTVIMGVVPVVNLPGIKPGEMHLTGAALADIYMGKVTKWNDKEIADLNPGMKLPEQDIAVVRRADGSGTTFVFTDYLSKVSPDWKSKVGSGSAVQWPLGLGGKGSEGVSAFVQRIPSSIGYVEYTYAKQNKMIYALVKNADGAYVQPDDTSFKAAAASADWQKSAFNEVLTDKPGKTTWPISTATFVLLHKTPQKPEQAREVLKFFDWSYKNGAKLASDLDYVPLPDSVVKLVNTSWTSVKDGSGKGIMQ